MIIGKTDFGELCSKTFCHLATVITYSIDPILYCANCSLGNHLDNDSSDYSSDNISNDNAELDFQKKNLGAS